MSTATAAKTGAGIGQLAVVLFAISALTALCLGLVNYVTAPIIAKNEAEKVAQAMNEVLPYDGEYTEVTYSGGDATVESVYQAGDQGYVVQVSPSGSFSGTLTVMVGVDSAGAVTGISIVKTSETAGLGAKAGEESFRSQFVGLTSASVTKDGGTVDALTGATITSRAVCNAVNSAIAAAASAG